MTHAANLNAFHQRGAEFFLQFPRECNLWRFAVPHLSAGELPLQRRSIAFPALADQHSPIATLNHCRNNGSHLSAFLCVLSVSALSFSSFFRTRFDFASAIRSTTLALPAPAAAPACSAIRR